MFNWNKIIFWGNVLSIFLNMMIMFNPNAEFSKRQNAAIWGVINCFCAYVMFDPAFKKDDKQEK
jgi:hypothetical protein